MERTAEFVPAPMADPFAQHHERARWTIRRAGAVQKVANTLGISQNIPHGPATYIGSFETDLKDLTAAYTRFSQCRSAQAVLRYRAN